MRVLFINQFYAPDAAATAQMLADLCTGLSSRGVEVVVVCSRTAYSASSAQAAGPRVPPGKYPPLVQVARVPALGFTRKSLLTRAASYLSFLGSAAVRSLFGKRPDVVVTLTTPPFVGLIGALLKRLRGCRFVLWSMDLYPEVAIAARALRPNSLAARLAGHVAKVIYRESDTVVALGPFMRQRILDYGVRPEQVRVIHNWADGRRIRPVPHEQNDFRTEIGLARQFVVMYSGNMGLGHRFDTVLHAAQALRERSHIRFVFIGEGPRRKEIVDRVEDSGLSNALLLPYQPRHDLARSLSAADVHLVSLRDDMQGLVVPSKIYGILAAGRPSILIGGDENEIAAIIQEHGCGSVVHEGDVRALTEAILALADSSGRRQAMGRRARRAFEEHYTFDVALAEWDRAFMDLARRSACRVPQRA